ncbi:MAG: histidine kinase, partial [Flavobacteriaceae bacterium]|nr:histidine kinase [Flavobacteriaceae bacterium]
SKKEVEKLALEFETEKKNKAIELLNVEKNLNEIQLKKSKQLQFAFLLAAVLILMILFLLRARHKNKVKTDKLLKESMERSFQMKLADSEMQALRAQMNPHFLFNCLNSINSFIIKNEQEQATEYLSKFSKLIRRVLNNSKEPKVTLGNEIETLKLYIELEALRFNNKFDYSIDIQPNVEIDYLEIPPLIIQPYVENSIWHGLMHKKEGDGKLNINITQEEDHIEVTIEDNGIGRDAASQLKSKSAEKRKSYGMNITSERLKNSINSTNETSHVEVIDLIDSNNNSLGTKVIIKIGI